MAWPRGHLVECTDWAVVAAESEVDSVAAVEVGAVGADADAADADADADAVDPGGVAARMM